MSIVPLLKAGLSASIPGQPSTAGYPASPMPGRSPREKKLMKECRQFESILIANLWNQMEKGIGWDPGNDPGAGTMQGFGIQAAATGIANAGGLGIARMLYRELAPHLNDAPSQSPATGRNHRA